MKKVHLYLLALPSLIILIALYFLFFSKISEKAHNEVMCYYVARRITDGLNNFTDKVIAIRDFVHEDIHPIRVYYNNPDTIAAEKLLTGIGWCDQQSRVFTQLAKRAGITTRLLFLRLSNGGSPHAVAEALTPDKRWVIVDSAYKLDLINKDGELASQSDIKENLDIVANNRRVKLRAKFGKRWADPNYLSIYANPPTYIVTKKGRTFDLLRPIPISWIRPIVKIVHDRYIDQIQHKIADAYESKMLKARGWHLLNYYEESQNLYDEIIRDSGNSLLRFKAEYYRALALEDQKKYEEAYQYISLIINKRIRSPYVSYLYSLRAAILDRMGRHEEAEEDLLKIEYMLDA